MSAANTTSLTKDVSVPILVPSTGIPLVVPSAVGDLPEVVIDATDPAGFLRIWGMTLVERNVRLVERLGARHIHVLVGPENRQGLQRRFSGPGQIQVHANIDNPLAAAQHIVQQAEGPVLLLEGVGLYDRRFIGALWQQSMPALGADRGSALTTLALLVTAAVPLLPTGNRFSSWSQVQQALLAKKDSFPVDLNNIESHISSLRKEVPPAVLRVNDASGRHRAKNYLKALAGKGVNDVMGEFVHPPIEFFLTRLVAFTPLTPNQISYFNALLNIAALPLLATGNLWEGLVLNLVRGVMDGVDGKLARLTLRESQGGDQIDHVVDRLYLPLFFLALGWHLSAGMWNAPAAMAAYVVQGFYWTNRLLANVFHNFLGVSSGEFRPIDRLVRRIWPKRNICVLILLIALLVGQPLGGLYTMTALTAAMTVFRLLRLNQESRRWHRRQLSENKSHCG